MDIKTILRDEIQDEMGLLNKIEVGTDEYSKSVDGIAKLFDKVIELEKIENEKHEKAEDRALEMLKLEDDRKDRFIKNCIATASIAVPTLLTIWGTCKSLKFEETGTVTTLVGRGFINKLLPKK